MLRLSASAFIVLAAEPSFVLIDTAVVGHLGPLPLGALGIGGTLLSLVAMIGAFLDYGTTGRAARWYGAGQRDRAVEEGTTASVLALVLGAAAVGAGELFAGPLLRLLAGGRGPVASAAETWFRIAVLGVPGILLVLAGNGWMRGVQDTRRPVRIVLIANALSAAASPILVYPLGLGLAGSAVANVTAQVVAGLLFVRAARGERRRWRPQWAVLRGQLSVGRELLLREAGFQAAFLTAAAVAARMGTAQGAAHQIGLELGEFTALLLHSFAARAWGPGRAGGRCRPRCPPHRLAGGTVRAGRRDRVQHAAGGWVVADPGRVHVLRRGAAPGPPAMAVLHRPAAGRRCCLRPGRRAHRGRRCRLPANGDTRRRSRSIRAHHAGRAALALGHRRGMGRAGRLHWRPADWHAGAHRPRPVGRDRDRDWNWGLAGGGLNHHRLCWAAMGSPAYSCIASRLSFAG